MGEGGERGINNPKYYCIIEILYDNLSIEIMGS